MCMYYNTYGMCYILHTLQVHVHYISTVHYYMYMYMLHITSNLYYLHRHCFVHIHVALLRENYCTSILFYFRTNSFSTVFPPSSDRPKYSRFEPPPHPPKREDWKTSKYCELCNSSLFGMVSTSNNNTCLHGESNKVVVIILY